MEASVKTKKKKNSSMPPKNPSEINFYGSLKSYLLNPGIKGK